jgi:hypothetical protein
MDYMYVGVLHHKCFCLMHKRQLKKIIITQYLTIMQKGQFF